MKNVYSTIEERCKQNCSCAVINVPVDQGLEGNIENENRTKGLALLFPFKVIALLSTILKLRQRTLWLWGQPHLPLIPEPQTPWAGTEEGFWWALATLGQGHRAHPRIWPAQIQWVPRFVWCFSWDA